MRFRFLKRIKWSADAVLEYNKPLTQHTIYIETQTKLFHAKIRRNPSISESLPYESIFF